MTERRPWRTLGSAWNDFFYAPFDLRWAAAIRIAFAFLVLVNLTFLGLDLGMWFGPDGVMPLDASRTIIDPDSHTIFEWLPDTNTTVRVCFVLAMLHATALLVGWFPRIQAFAVFFWLLAFQNRHMMIFDGEDQLFRLFAFFLVFVPTHHHFSVHTLLRRASGPVTGPAWGLRFVQIQITLVYFGTAVQKLHGAEWIDGTALYYVSRLDDAFGRFPFPYSLFDSLAAIKALTWSTLALELVLPVALWLRPTRVIARVIAGRVHVSLDYTMNLFLFHPIMLVGLLAFAARPRLSRSAAP